MLTGSDSAPAKANEAKQANDIGAMKDEISLVAQNAQMDAYNDVYVDNNSTVTRGQASTTVGQKVIDEILKHFGGTTRGSSTDKITRETTRGNVTVKIEQEFEDNAKITISTTDVEKEGTVAYNGGALIWGELAENVPETKTDASASATTATSHTPQNLTASSPTGLGLSWSKLSDLATIISNTSTIGRTTLEVTVNDGTNSYTLGVGDTATVNYDGSSKTVRILGFNHDTLTSDTTKKAGISFEFVSLLDQGAINTEWQFSGGWGVATLRNQLNSTYLNKLDIKDYLKEVNKDYLSRTTSANVKTTGVDTDTGDKLWLLSVSEIYATGYEDYTAFKEGEQYEFYGNIGSTECSEIKEMLIKEGGFWWLRTPYPEDNLTSSFWCVYGSDGGFDNYGASDDYDIAPCFAI